MNSKYLCLLKSSIHFFISSFIIVSSYLIILLSINLGEISFQEIIISLSEILMILILISFLLTLVSKKLMWFLPFGIILNFQYQNIYDLLSNYISLSQVVLVGLIGILWLMVVFIFWNSKERDAVNVNYILSLTILAGTIIQISLNYEDEGFIPSSEPLIFLDESLIDYIDEPAEMPNIIYLVPDRYAGFDVLEEYYNFDNDNFYNELLKRGFVVPRVSNSNYPNTFTSLLSTLNLNYIESKDYAISDTASFPLIKNSLGFRLLKKIGYKFSNFDNWWNGTRDNNLADRNIYKEITNLNFSLTTILIDKTPIYKLVSRYYPQINPRFSCANQTKIFDLLLEESLKQDQGMFIFAHLLAPHSPYLFDSEGVCFTRKNVTKSQITSHGYKREDDFLIAKKNYTEYLSYTNKKILEIFDSTLAKNDNFIFVIQSDEGPYPKCMQLKTECTNADWKIKTSNINAFFYSKGSSISEEDLKTPINNFNHILNIILEQKREGLPHQIFINSNPNFHLSDSMENFNFKKFESK